MPQALDILAIAAHRDDVEQTYGIFLVATLAVLLTPLATTLWSRHFALAAQQGQAAIWRVSRLRAEVFRLCVVAFWWMVWDSPQAPILISLLSPDCPAWLLFWIPPIAGIGLGQLASCLIGRTILEQRWTNLELLRLALWSTVSPTVALLLVANGFEALYRGNLKGILALLLAGVVAVVSNARLKSAQGFHFRKVKSGELYNRAFQLAKKMKVKLAWVNIMPAGRGDLTNACAGWQSIAVSDNYGKFLTRPQLEFVISHELAHLRQKHRYQSFLITPAIFIVLTVALFRLSPSALGFRPGIDLIVVFGPLLVFYSLSRRSEYAADRCAVEFTDDPQSALKALAKLYQFTRTPARSGRLTELFLTHPSLVRRAAAIARTKRIPIELVDNILARAGLVEPESVTPVPSSAE